MFGEKIRITGSQRTVVKTRMKKEIFQ